MPPPNSLADLQQNLPFIGADALLNIAIFGNTSYQIMPSQSGEVSNTFGTIPYVSPSTVMYLQQIQSATLPTNVTSGNTPGQQNVTGNLTVTDASGNVVAQIGAGSLSSSGAASTSQPTT